MAHPQQSQRSAVVFTLTEIITQIKYFPNNIFLTFDQKKWVLPKQHPFANLNKHFKAKCFIS